MLGRCPQESPEILIRDLPQSKPTNFQVSNSNFRGEHRDPDVPTFVGMTFVGDRLVDLWDVDVTMKGMHVIGYTSRKKSTLQNPPRMKWMKDKLPFQKWEPFSNNMLGGGKPHLFGKLGRTSKQCGSRTLGEIPLDNSRRNNLAPEKIPGYKRQPVILHPFLRGALWNIFLVAYVARKFSIRKSSPTNRPIHTTMKPYRDTDPSCGPRNK